MSNSVEALMERISNWLYNLQKLVLLILVTVITVINMAQITGRYVFHFSLPWSEQLSVLLFIVIIMLGGSISIRSNSEIRIAFFNFKNAVAQKCLDLLVDLISFATIIFFITSSVAFFKHSLRFKQVVSSMQISYSYVFIFLIIGFSLMGLEKLFSIVRNIISLTNTKS